MKGSALRRSAPTPIHSTSQLIVEVITRVGLVEPQGLPALGGSTAGVGHGHDQACATGATRACFSYRSVRLVTIDQGVSRVRAAPDLTRLVGVLEAQIR